MEAATKERERGRRRTKGVEWMEEKGGKGWNGRDGA